MAEPVAVAASSSAGPSSSSPKAGPSTLPPLYVPPKPIPPRKPPKPILKKPPPPPQPFFSFTKSVFSISSKFLPQQGGPPAAASRGISPAPANGSAPANGKTPEASVDPSPLKRAHFIIPHQQTTYPISSQAPPSTPGLQDSIKDIEEREAERRIRDNNDSNWTLERVEEFYKECCRQREEAVLVPVVRAIQGAGPVAPRTLDLTGIKLTQFSAATLADALSMEWGLRRLILKDCDLDDLSIKPILHALLIPQTLPYLSLSGNKRLKPPAFKLIGIFAQKANALQFLDLSGTPIEKRSVEYIIGALESAPPSQPKSSADASPSMTPMSASTPLISEGGSTSYFSSTIGSRTSDGLPPSGFSTPAGLGVFTNGHDSPRPNGPGTPLGTSPNPSFSNLPLSPTDGPASPRSYQPATLPPKIPKAKLISLRLDEAGVRGGSLEVLAHAVRPSCLVNLSLRGNRIGPTGAVALALMMKDYPDSMPVVSGAPGLLAPGSPQSNSLTFGSGLGLETPPSPRPSPFNNAPPKPPPRHPLLQQQAAAPNPAPGTSSIQPTYTPYIPRARRNMVPAPQPQNIPVITSSKTGGVTMRHNPPAPSSPMTRAANLSGKPEPLKPAVPPKVDGHSAALLDKVRSLDNLPRLGSLQTLDLRGNDLRNGVTYIAQVLKRNRTLKVLNLSENRVDASGLVAIAEALKYNSTLETLDMSRNPCCGPGIEGITSIRTAFTINTSLKRLFLSNTNLTSPGAIALAEFLPEARHLLHLDLTANGLDIAGVMALSVGLKMNETIRCLDVNVPPNDPEFARLSREILKCCVRNTERAAGEVGRFEHGGSSLGSSDGLGLGLGLGFGGGGGMRGGVWGLIEKSELAKVVKEEAEKERLDEEKRQLGTLSGKEKYDVWKKTPPEVIRAAKECSEDLQLLLGGILPADNGRKERLVERAQILAGVIAEMVQVEADTDTLQELLSLNDELLGFVKRIKTALNLTLTLDMPGDIDPSELMSPTKIDRKGKGRATPQDEEPPELPFSFRPKPEDRVLEEVEERPEGHPSPVERSRKWVEEEGEVFRKGQILLGPEEMGDVEEGDGAQVSGEELRVELLEAQVERPKPRLVEHGHEGSEDSVTSPRREGSEERRSPLSPR